MFDLLTCDVWDTILRRNCHPDEVKLATSRHLLAMLGTQVEAQQRDPMTLVRDRQQCESILAQASRSAGMDDEYTAAEVLTLLIELVAPGVDPAQRSHFAAQLVQREIEHELAVISLDPDILASIIDIPHRRLGFVSDFYHGADVIRILLQKVGIAERFTVGFVSCDHRLNKRSGRLYRKVHQELGIQPSQHAHIGDNMKVDVERAGDIGIKAFHFPGRIGARARSVHEHRWEFRQKDRGWLSTCVIGSNEGFGPTNQRLVEDLTLIIGGFIYFAAESAHRSGCERIFFCTREGEFFLKVFDALQKNGAIPAHVKAGLVEVSRIATFGPSLRSLDIPELMRIWNQYSTQSLAAFLKSLNAPLEDYRPAMVAHAIDPQEVITYPWLDRRVQALLADARFKDPLSAHLAEHRCCLLGYLASRGVPTAAPFALVDIGWRGTIQDNLCHLLPQSTIHGYYLGLQPFLNPQPENATKTAFGPNLNQKNHSLYDALCMQFISPLEMLCNSPHGSVVGYAASAPHAAVRVVDPVENITWEVFSSRIQASVLSSIPALATMLRDLAVSGDDIQPLANDRLYRLLTLPPQSLSSEYFALQHDETFGVGSRVKRKFSLPVRLTLNASLSRKARGDLMEFLYSTSWPQGFLVMKGLAWLLPNLNRALLKRLKRTR